MFYEMARDKAHCEKVPLGLLERYFNKKYDMNQEPREPCIAVSSALGSCITIRVDIYFPLLFSASAFAISSAMIVLFSISSPNP